jgi:hypothetical protein
MRRKNVTLLASVAMIAACEPALSTVQPASSSSYSCCGSIGLCVTPGLATDALYQRLSSAECDEGFSCMPLDWALGVIVIPASCRTPHDLEGRCLPSCMPELAGKSARFPQGTCEADFLCVPCFDPLTGEDTEACRIEQDPGPEEPARVLAPCCDDGGRCSAPAALASFSEAELRQLGAQADLLQQDSCSDAELCVPCADADCCPAEASEPTTPVM